MLPMHGSHAAWHVIFPSCLSTPPFRSAPPPSPAAACAGPDGHRGGRLPAAVAGAALRAPAEAAAGGHARDRWGCGHALQPCACVAESASLSGVAASYGACLLPSFPRRPAAAGLSALLAAKAALLHRQRCGHQPPSSNAAAPAAGAEAPAVLPLLGLAVSGAALGASGPPCLPAQTLRSVQQQWEAVYGFHLHCPPGGSGATAPIPLAFSLLAPSPLSSCPTCGGQADAAGGFPQAWWPPRDNAEVLQALGEGLPHLQSLDIGGSGGWPALAAAVARCTCGGWGCVRAWAC